jgi:hypothetical protein
MGLELVSREVTEISKTEVKRLQEIINAFILKASCYMNHGKQKEVRILMASNPGRFVQFDSKKVDTAMVLTINKTAFIAGSRLAYMRRHGSSKVWGKTNRFVVDVYKQPEERLQNIYGGEAFTEVVKAVLTLERNGIPVPKFEQEKLIFSKEKVKHIKEEDVSVVPEPVVEQQQVVVEAVPAEIKIGINNSDFNAIRDTVKAMYVADLLNDKIKSEVNGMILEKLFTMDFVEEILSNRF